MHSFFQESGTKQTLRMFYMKQTQSQAVRTLLPPPPSSLLQSFACRLRSLSVWGCNPAVLLEWRPSSTREEMQPCAQHSPPDTSDLRAGILIVTSRRIMWGWHAYRYQARSGCVTGIDLPSRSILDLKSIIVGGVLLNQLWYCCNFRLMRNLCFSAYSC